MHKNQNTGQLSSLMSHAAGLVAPDLLKTLAIQSDTIISRYAVDPEDLNHTENWGNP